MSADILRSCHASLDRELARHKQSCYESPKAIAEREARKRELREERDQIERRRERRDIEYQERRESIEREYRERRDRGEIEERERRDREEREERERRAKECDWCGGVLGEEQIFFCSPKCGDEYSAQLKQKELQQKKKELEELRKNYKNYLSEYASYSSLDDYLLKRLSLEEITNDIKFQIKLILYPSVPLYFFWDDRTFFLLRLVIYIVMFPGVVCLPFFVVSWCHTRLQYFNLKKIRMEYLKDLEKYHPEGIIAVKLKFGINLDKFGIKISQSTAKSLGISDEELGL